MIFSFGLLILSHAFGSSPWPRIHRILSRSPFVPPVPAPIFAHSSRALSLISHFNLFPSSVCNPVLPPPIYFLRPPVLQTYPAGHLLPPRTILFASSINRSHSSDLGSHIEPGDPIGRRLSSHSPLPPTPFHLLSHTSLLDFLPLRYGQVVPPMVV